MRPSIFVLGVGMMLLPAPPILSQEHCNELLSHGIRNEWVSIDQAEWDNLIFHRHCKQSGSSWSFSHDGKVGLPAPVPLQIAGDWFASQESSDDFCKKQAENSSGKEMEAARLSLLSSDALQAWNQCQALASKNVRIETGDLNQALLGFSVSRIAMLK